MSDFKALIIGAGLNGLLTALALQRAGIDFVILEKRQVADLNWGASLCLWPHSVRILNQLGLLEEAEQIYLPMKKKYNLRRDGSVFASSNLPSDVKKLHGYDWMLFQRAQLIKLLKSHISDLDNLLLLEKHVTAIKPGTDEVNVTCSDGTSYSGSIVIGADGVHSKARSFIDKATAGSAIDGATYAKGTFKTNYYAVFGCGEALSSDLESQAVYETHVEGFCTQLFVVSPEKYMFTIFDKLPSPTRKRQWLSPEKADDLMKRHADTCVAPGITCKQVWEAKTWSYLSPLEEGIAKTWSEDRVVLLGDSSMKMTPNLGFGVNTGWQSAVILTNLLRALLAETPSPETKDLSRVFAEYHRLCRGPAKKYVRLSAFGTRVETWDKWIWKISDQYIVPHVGGDMGLVKYLCAPLIKRSFVLDFLPEPNLREGKVKWTRQSPTK